MYVHNTDKKPVLIFKHLELAFLNLLNEHDFNYLRENYLIGYYFGGNYYDRIKFLPDFYICIPGLNDWLREYFADIAWFPFSGFNFLPESAFKEDRVDVMRPDAVKLHSKTPYILYIGDFSQRKGLPEALHFLAENSELRAILVLRVSSYTEKLIAQIISLHARCRTGGRIEIVVPQTGITHSRNQVFDWLRNSSSVLMPYKSEGAARVFAEAEICGKPIIFNELMTGGTLHFSHSSENITISDFTPERFSKLQTKSAHEKAKIYLSKSTTEEYKKFLEEYFGLLVDLDPERLVNAFSGHRNDQSPVFTSRTTDEIKSFSKLRKFFASNNIFISKLSFTKQSKLYLEYKFLSLKKMLVKLKIYWLVIRAVSKIKNTR